MSEAHLSSDDLAAFAAKRLEAPRVQAVFAHLSSCPRCRSTWQQAMDAGRAAERVRDELLRDHAPQLRRRRVLVQVLAAALAIAVIGALLLFLRKPAPSPVPEVVQTAPPRTETAVVPTPPPPAPEPEHPLIAAALHHGRLPPPDVLAALLAAPAFEPTRGGEGTVAATYEPDREVVASQRPRFRFPAERGFPTVVRVFDRDREVLASEPVDSGEWTATANLKRGVTYTWQVESTRDGETVVAPAPPAPPARFAVVDDESWRALEAARRDQPGNHLLLGILAARAGLRDEAERELRRDPRAAALLRSVRAWPG